LQSGQPHTQVRVSADPAMNYEAKFASEIPIL